MKILYIYYENNRPRELFITSKEPTLMEKWIIPQAPKFLQ